MLELGKRPVQLWLTSDEYDIIKKAADQDDRPMTVFCIRASLENARKFISEKDGK